MLENTILLKDIFTLKNILLYLLMINIIGFFMMWSDKRKAKKHTLIINYSGIAPEKIEEAVDASIKTNISPCQLCHQLIVILIWALLVRTSPYGVKTGCLSFKMFICVVLNPELALEPPVTPLFRKIELCRTGSPREMITEVTILSIHI